MHLPELTRSRCSCLFLDGMQFLFLFLGLCCLVGPWLQAADGRLEVTFIDFGQADAIRASCPDGNHDLLIDSGDTRYPKSSKNFRSFLTNAFNGKPRQLDVVVSSHAHADHIGSMEWVLKNSQMDTDIGNGDASGETT